MIVCICRRVSDHQIRRAAAEGAVSLACLQQELGVATCCGRCAECAERVLCEARAGAAPVAAMPMQRRFEIVPARAEHAA